MVNTLSSLDVYRGKRILLTGHTGFKGSWLSLWLRELGAEVHGYALASATDPSLFDALQLSRRIDHAVGDIRDVDAFRQRIVASKPDIIFHLAAQPLVRDSYRDPSGTFATNATGTLNLLEILRETKTRAAVVMITTDKVYRNANDGKAFVETDPYGGEDPYSMSKAVCELIIDSYRASFFRSENFAEHGVALASARAGNCIGGGDFSADRLLPDMARAFAKDEPVVLRNPRYTRPWQHVLEPLHGYLLLGAKLLSQEPQPFMSGYNFAPDLIDAQPVEIVAELFAKAWGKGTIRKAEQHDVVMHEAELLTLSYQKAAVQLGWRPRWNLATALQESARWYREFAKDSSVAEQLCLEQIQSFTRATSTSKGI